MMDMFRDCVEGTIDLIEKQMEQSTRRRPDVSTASMMLFSQASSERTDTDLPRQFSSRADCRGTSIINGKSASWPSGPTWHSSTARMEVTGISP